MCLPIAPARLQEIITETKKDSNLTAVKKNPPPGMAR
jgi:hypothetical protein